MAGDPYFGADLFESVTIWATAPTLARNAPGPKVLSGQLAAAVLTAAAAC